MINLYGMKSLTLFVFTFLFFSFITNHAQTGSASNELRKKHFRLNHHGVALDGYDPVSYFSDKPTKGKSELSFEYKGIIYHFTSIENRKKFEKNPEKFEPEYGGWCAFAMGENGDKVEVDPMRYKIINGKINLFYNGILGDTLIPWNENEKELIPKANANWNMVMK
ncbi:YHS domain-containing (seleno)protein [Leptospira levettii]|uniref:YHS domain-containing (seleno)protein n=1 Tax=Leptospira levettii TaxID=2023178 RepID=UPI001A9C2F71|nr:YHS domain-containing (seleno)protein [Leptospira levettii]